MANVRHIFPALAFLAAYGVAEAQPSPPGWRQWGGPTGNFHVEGARLATSWPLVGPKRLWDRPLGEGYSSIVADEGTLYTMYRDGEREIVIALDATTGTTRWQHAYPAPLLNDGGFGIWQNSAGPGPFSTPLIAGNAIFTVGLNGQFHALARDTGSVIWSRNLVSEFKLSGYHGFAPSPLLYGDTVILPVGGSGQGVIAFRRHDGSVAWKSQDFGLAQASPSLIKVDGQDQLVVLGPQQLVGLDPGDGKLLWSHPHRNNLGLNISTPVWGAGNLLFASSAYDSGSRVIRLTRAGGQTRAEELWFNNRLRVHFGNAIRIGDLVLFTSGDFGPAFFAAVNVNTGQEVWRERSFGRSHLLSADGKLVIVDEDGEVAVATVGAAGLNVLAKASVLTENAWTPPTLVGSTLYVRDRKRIFALDLGR